MPDMEHHSPLFSDACHLLFDCDTFEQQSQGFLLLEKAAKENDPLALCLLGDFYLYGKKGLVPKNVSKSTYCYLSAWELISSHFIQDDDPDSSDAQEEDSDPIDWHYAAKVCFCMGTVFLYGRSYIEDYDLAEMFFRNASYGYHVLQNEGVPGAEKKMKKAEDLALTAYNRKCQLTQHIYIYEKATLKDKPFTVYPFHAVHRSIMDVYNVEVNRFLCEQIGVPYSGENESFFYCYADETRGLVLRALGFFHHGAYQIIPESMSIQFSYADFKAWSVSLGTIPTFVYRYHRDLCRQLMETYEKNPTIMRICLDSLRSREFPYDIQAILVSPTESSESVWYRPVEMDQFTLRGTLLNEPHGSFGIHQGDVVQGQLSFPEGEATVVIYGFPSTSNQEGNRKNSRSGTAFS